MARHLARTLALALTAVAAACAGVAEVPAPAPAHDTAPALTAALPLQSAASLGGLASPTDDVVFRTSTHGDRTIVTAVDAASGSVLARESLAGRFELPQVTQTGMLGGISHDGETLVLAEAPSAVVRSSTRFAALDTELAEPPRFLEVDGDFSFDALSPGGRRLFLVEHLPPVGSAHYQVRMLHLETGELDPTVIVDKRFPDERMKGYPLARAESADGLWVYTLYRDGTRNFVHSLMTDGYAFCIDLPTAGSPDGPWTLTVEPGGGTLAVTNIADRAGTAIDMASLSVRQA